MTDPLTGQFQADIERALLPIAGERRTGTSLRYSATYREIRQARREDDATVPQGEWERPLKKADWPLVVRLCLAALETGSKDLQIAAWLCEAWVRLHGIRGMSAGVRLLDGMVASFWEDAYPPDEDDGEARLGIIEWLRETLLVAVTMHIPLLEFDDAGEPALNLDDWQRLIVGKPALPGRERPDQATLAARVAGARLDGLIAMRRDIDALLDQWALFARRLDTLWDGGGPSLAAIAERLSALARAADSLIDGREPVARAGTGPLAEDGREEGGRGEDGRGEDAAARQDLSRETPGERSASSRDAVASREEAYALLAKVGAYLREHEPHSPTPYLIERALAWGRMPLRELMEEVLSEEGGMRWYAAMLGLDANRE